MPNYYEKPIGTDPWFDINIFDNNRNNFTGVNAVFLDGGQSAIRFILEEIKLEENEYILLPSYLCSTILYHFKLMNKKYRFYKVNEDLHLDIDDISSIIEEVKVKALFVIDYFGFYHDERTLGYLELLKQNSILIVEDAAQMLWFNKVKFIGDYVYNSYRKFLPIDGSLVLCNNNKAFISVEDDYYRNINMARLKKTAYINFHIGSVDDYLKLFSLADKAYYQRTRVFGMHSESKKMLSLVNYEFIKSTRIKNFMYLYEKLKQIKQIKTLFNINDITDNVPLGLPILIENRDNIRKSILNYSVYCPVHWDLRNENQLSSYNENVYLSTRILTIPIDQRYDLRDMKKIIDAIKESI